MASLSTDTTHKARERIIYTWRIDTLELLLAGWESIRASDLATLQCVAPSACEALTLAALNPLVDDKILVREMLEDLSTWRMADRAAARAWLKANCGKDAAECGQ